MFDFPSRKDLSQQRDEEYSEWFDSVRESEVAVIGANPAGFIAGIVLGDNGRDVVILEESEQIGGRLFWESGPIPIISPADEILEDLGFSIHSNPPIWLDRIHLIDFLLHRFLESGGRVIPGGYLDSATRSDETVELSIRLGDRRETLETGDFVVTDPRLDLDYDRENDGQTPLESMVINTDRTSSGWVSAGFQALSDDQRDQDYPFVNAELLSGRKAAELVIAGD